MLATICEIDKINNQMCSKFIHGSVCLDMQKLLNLELPVDVSAAYILCHVIQKGQGVNFTAGHQLFKQIEVMRLSKEPGYNVDTFCSKLHVHCTTLKGLGESHVINDLSVIIAACFDTTGIQQFDLEMATLSNKLDENITAFTWGEILSHAKTKFL